MTVAYLDASALVKLMRPEPETDALIQALSDWRVRVASEIVAIELVCTARRLGGKRLVERAKAIADRLHLVPFSASVHRRATDMDVKPALRALDAIHLATALELSEDLDVLVAYDRDLCQAAKAGGLSVRTPS